MIINSVISGGGGEQPTGDYTVKVIDYDGTVLLETKGNTGDVIELPTAPTHDKLVFQEWSASVVVTNNAVTIEDNDVMVGAVYTTASGKSEFDITLTKVTGLSVTLNMDGTKDWGDGTSDTATTHTYTAYGDYTIACDGTTMTTSSSSGLFGQGRTAKNYYCIGARLANVTSIGNYAFQYSYSLTNITIPSSVINIGGNLFYYCLSLTSITIPNSVTIIGSTVFSSCYSLTNITLPNSVTSIGNSAFSSCYSLSNITIPSSVTMGIGSSVFSSCYSLTNIIIPSSVTSIAGDDVFYNCYSITKYDFSQHTSVPTLSNTNAFNGINGICKIIVPDSLYDSWIAATNWSTYADYIYKVSEVQ